MSAPLAKTDEIVMLGGNDQLTGEVNRLVGQIPPAVNALTGVDLSKVVCNTLLRINMEIKNCSNIYLFVSGLE